MPPRAKNVLGVKTPGPSALTESNSLHDEKENVLSGPLSAAAEELEKVMRRIESISVEKDIALQAVIDRETELQKKVDERQRLQSLLSANEQDQKDLLERVRKLEKARDSEYFRPTILLMNMPSDSSPIATSVRKDLTKKTAAKNENVKEPKSPFLLWCKEHRKEVKKEYPEASFTKVSRLLREKWKNLPQVEKVPFIVQYLIAKDAHRKGASKGINEPGAVTVFKGGKDKKNLKGLLRQYLEYNTEEESGIKETKKEDDPEKPRKPTSGYIVYMNERKVQLRSEKMKVNEMRRCIREEWKLLDEEQKKPYQTVAAEDRARYAAELRAYKSKKAAELEKADIQDMQKKVVRVEKAKIQGMELVVVEDDNNQSEERQDVFTQGEDLYKSLEKAVKEPEDQDKDRGKVLKAQARKSVKPKQQTDQVKVQTPKDVKLKKKRGKAPVDPNMPKKPLPPYLLFAKENRAAVKEEMPGASFAEINATLAIKWQDMSSEEKQVWEDKAAEARDKFNEEMEQYNGKKQESVPATTS